MKNVKRYMFLLLIPIITLFLGGCGGSTDEEKAEKLKPIYEKFLKAGICANTGIVYQNDKIELSESGLKLIELESGELEQIVNENLESIKAVESPGFFMMKTLNDEEEEKLEKSKKKMIILLNQSKLKIQLSTKEFKNRYQTKKYEDEKRVLEKNLNDAKETFNKEKIVQIENDLIELKSKIAKEEEIKEAIVIERKNYETEWQKNNIGNKEMQVVAIFEELPYIKGNDKKLEKWLEEVSQKEIEIYSDFAKRRNEMNVKDKVSNVEEQTKKAKAIGNSPLDSNDYELGGNLRNVSLDGTLNVNGRYKCNATPISIETNELGICYKYEGFTLYFANSGKKTEEEMTKIVINGPNIKTYRDLEVSMPVDEVFRAYGTTYTKTSDENVDIYNYKNLTTRLHTNGGMLRIAVNKDTQLVQSITLEKGID